MEVWNDRVLDHGRVCSNGILLLRDCEQVTGFEQVFETPGENRTPRTLGLDLLNSSGKTVDFSVWRVYPKGMSQMKFIPAATITAGMTIAVYEVWDERNENWALGAPFIAQNDAAFWFDTFSIIGSDGADHCVETDEEVLLWL